MKETIIKLLEENEKIKKLKDLPIATLKILKMYLDNGLADVVEQKEDEIKNNTFSYRTVRTCIAQDYNYLIKIMDCRNRIDLEDARALNKKNIGKKLGLCRDCLLKECIKDTVSEFLFEMKKVNKELEKAINPAEIVNEILNDKLKAPEDNTKYETEIDKSLFSSVAVYTLLYVQAILDNNFVEMEDFNKDTRIAKFKYVDLTKRENFNFYINKLYEYYDHKSYKELEINVDNFELLPYENLADYEYFYKLAAFYLYKMQVEKMNVKEELDKYLQERDKDIIRNRSKFFAGIYNNKVEELPCNQKTKSKIKSVFNYILNYFADANTPYVPINIAMYTEDAELVDKIARIIGSYMWYFTYLSNDMRYYYKSMNEILLNKSELRTLYTFEKDNKIYNKYGILTIDNFENIMFASQMDKNMILNILTEKIANNNSRVCNIIYGNKETIKSILSPYQKLSTSLFNIELDIDELSVEEVYKMLIERIELKEKLPDEIKEKIYNYIKLTYGNSELKNTEYVKVLYNKIILKEYDMFNELQKPVMKIEDIPSAYNTRDLPEILAELNSLVGLDKIKEQINNLISLLKFNKNANIDISKFNLHMIFTGNPGTGKTTVARLLSDILFNLGYTRKNKLVEVSAKDLIAEYIGQTSGKTYNVMKSAFGGVLFIDEAYSIIDSDGKGTFASDCISTILKVMEDQRDNIIVIFAGYEKEMENFVKFNPGLQSRIGYKIEFDDYSIEELTQIFDNLLTKNNFKITEEAEQQVRYIIEQSSKIENFGNARYINKMYQDILIAHSKNVEDVTDKEKLMLITENDINEDDLIVKEKTGRKIGF